MTSTQQKPPKDSTVRVRAPWDTTKRWPIPWSQRTYCLECLTGRIKMLHEDWEGIPGPAGEIASYAKRKGSLVNKAKDPVLTYEQALAVTKAAEAEDIPIKVAFAKVVGTDKLSAYDFERLATAPEKFPTLQIIVQEDLEQKRRASLDRFKAFLEGPVDEPVKGPPVKKVTAGI